MGSYDYEVLGGEGVRFNNEALFCVGTGRMGLALQKEYHDQLEFVQKEIGFQYIRGHGLFCDDMAIYQTYVRDGDGNQLSSAMVEYNFTYLDRVFDDYLAMSIKPFIEFGFMPGKLASGDQTTFYWKANVTPPKDYDQWADLIRAFLNHVVERYGRDEVLTWLFEVWNEPNLKGFWKDSDMEEYFRLYEVTSRAVKSIDRDLRVGGPAICGVDDERWLAEFLTFCNRGEVPIDFVTRHVYTTDEPVWRGRYSYQELRAFQVVVDELDASRSIIDRFPRYKGMEMHVTEFNTSYVPTCPLHDTNLNAAYVARMLSFMGDTCASYAYWTFGDAFEESGVPFTLFHGGFGLVANGGIPKPTFWTFVFYGRLGRGDGVTTILRNERAVITRQADGSLRGVAWNPVMAPLALSGQGSFQQGQEARTVEGDSGAGEASSMLTLNFTFSLEDGEYLVLVEMVDEKTCNPLATWHNLGRPAHPTAECRQRIRQSATPRLYTERRSIQGGVLRFPLVLDKNAVAYFTIEKLTPQNHRGNHVQLV